MPDSAARPDIDQDWEKLLRQLRTQVPAPPRPFFYHRVQARLVPAAHRRGLPGWVRRPAYAMLFGALVLALSGDDVAFASGNARAAAGSPAPPR